MSRSLEINAGIISVLATAAIKISYGIENIVVVLAINILLAAATYFILRAQEKGSTDKQKEIEEKFMGIISQRTLELQKLEENLNANYKNLYEELHNIEKLLNDQINSNKLCSSNISEILERNIEGNKAILLNQEQTNLEIKSSSQNLKDIFLDCKAGTEKQVDIIKVLSEQLDKLADIHTSVNLIDDKQKEALNSLENLNRTVESEKNEIVYLRKNTEAVVQGCIKSNEKIVDRYKEIQQTTVGEMSKLTHKNEYLMRLLQDSYKVLKGATISS